MEDFCLPFHVASTTIVWAPTFLLFAIPATKVGHVFIYEYTIEFFHLDFSCCVTISVGSYLKYQSLISSLIRFQLTVSAGTFPG